MMLALVAGGSGILFGVGLAFSGMIDPARVLGFLDVAGAWDPTLAFVMAGAIAVMAPTWLLVFRRAAPTATHLALPTKRDIDVRLVSGAALFGVGWGLVGFCPGPALAALPIGGVSVLVFVAAMIGGMGLFEITVGRTQHPTPSTVAP
jgi:uncharacterized membrane protein YedE/YeeE